MPWISRYFHFILPAIKKKKKKQQFAISFIFWGGFSPCFVQCGSLAEYFQITHKPARHFFVSLFFFYVYPVYPVLVSDCVCVRVLMSRHFSLKFVSFIGSVFKTKTKKEIIWIYFLWFVFWNIPWLQFALCIETFSLKPQWK